MAFEITVLDYIEYLKQTAKTIQENKDYVSELDAATGDGDHWANINSGFQKVIKAEKELSELSISEMLKKIAVIMMSGIGGSSGVLYGSAYLEAAKVLSESKTINNHNLCDVLNAMCMAIMQRGNTKPGYKTMVDTIYPAVEAYKDALSKGIPEKEMLMKVKEAAIDGAKKTAEMEAVRGRACYQKNKGVGHIDPGSVTMSYIISDLIDYILSHCFEK